MRWLPIIALLSLLVACDSVEERVQEHYQRGQELELAGEPAKAILEYRNALRLNESFVPARFELAELLEEEREYRSVVGHLLKVVELEPAHVGARSKLARLMLVAGQLDQALTHSEAAYKAAPEDPDVLALRATVALNLGNAETALASAERALTIDPTNGPAAVALSAYHLRQGDSVKALAVLDGAIAKDQASLPLRVAKMQVLAEIGDEAAIGPYLEELVTAFPKETGFRRALIAWYLQEDAMTAAEQEMRALIALDPTDTIAVLDLIRLLVETKGPEVARAELVARLEAAPTSFSLKSALAAFDYENGAKDEAKALLRRIAEGTGDDADAARIQLARFLAGEGSDTEAEGLVGDVLKRDPKNVAALTMRGRLKMESGDLEGAILDLRAALNESTEDADLLALAAVAYERDGRTELANDSFRSALQASGYRTDLVLLYADFLARSQEPETLEVVLTEAARQRPNERAILEALAQVRLRLGDWVGAEEVARSLRELSDDGRAANRIMAAALSGQQRFGESIDVLRQMMDSADASNGAMAALVGVYNRAGEPELAGAFLASVLEKDPNNAQATLLQAGLAMQRNDIPAAEERLRAVIALAPRHHAGYEALAQLYLRQGRSADAETVLAQGMARIDEPDRLRLLRAINHQFLGNVDAAIDEYIVLFKQQPDSIVVANNLASLLSDHRSDDPESLRLAVSAAKRLRNSEEPSFQDTYGWIAYLQGQYGEALRSLKPAAEALPDNPWVRYHAGMTYAALEQAEEARIHLRAALELGGLDEASTRAAEDKLADLEKSPAASGQ